MPTVKSDKLMKSVRSGEIAPIYFFYGPEIQLMRNTVDLIVSQTVEPAFEGFNLHRYEDDALSAGELKSIYETLPMMAKYRCITIKNWNLDKLAKQDLERLYPCWETRIHRLYWYFTTPGKALSRRKMQNTRKFMRPLKKTAL